MKFFFLIVWIINIEITIFQVESQTNEKIKDLLSSDSVDGDTRLVLINALYFKVSIFTFDLYFYTQIYDVLV